MNEWKSTHELREWMKQHYEGMNPNGVWMPEGTGLTYQKTESGYTLVKMMDMRSISLFILPHLLCV